MKLVHKNIQQAGYGLLLVLLFGTLIFAASNRLGTANSFEHHILNVVSDHYYQIFFIIPLLIIYIFLFIEDDSKLVIVRFRSYFSYFCHKWLGSGLIALLFVIVQTAGIMMSGLSLSGGNVWTSSTNIATEELFTVFKQYFANPFNTFVAFTLFQFFGIWMFIGLCMWLNHFIGKTHTIRLIILLYFFAAIWLKLPDLHQYPVTGLNHLLILHHNLGGRQRILITAVTVILLTLLVLFTVRFFWNSHIYIPLHKKSCKGLFPYYVRELLTSKNMIILCSVCASIFLYKGLQSFQFETSAEWIWNLFSKHGTGYFQMLPFLEMLIVNGVFLYLSASFIEKAVSGQSSLIVIRVGSRRRQLISLLSAISVFLLLYCTIWSIGSYFSLIWSGYHFTVTAFLALMSSIALIFFDLLFQFMIMLVIYLFTKQITWGFLALLAGNFLCVMPIHLTVYLPFGMSNMARINHYNAISGLSFSMAAWILSSLVVIALLWLIQFGYKKI